MRVKAWLAGHSLDLGTLVQLFRDGDPQVVSDDEGYYLTSARFDAVRDNASQLYEAASSLLRRTNGVARVLDSSFRPVTLVGRFSDPSGSIHHVALAETAEARTHAFVAVVGEMSDEPQPPPLGPRYVALAEDHTDVAEILNILGMPNAQVTWIELYKAFEVVRDDAGGESALKEKGWVSRTQLSTFKESANRPEISGSGARHARSRGKSSKRSMTLDEGRAFIGRLVVDWWDSLRATTP